MKYKYLIYITALFFFSCEGGADSGILGDEGRKVCEKFYSNILKGDLKSSAKMCGGQLTYNDGLNLLLEIESLLGKLDSTQYINGIYKTVYRNNTARSEYQLRFKGFYNQRSTDESFVLIKIGDSLKVDGYYIKEILAEGTGK